MSSLSQGRSTVTYRFAHETNESFKTLEFDSDKITVSDLKILIARATGLEKEFARKFDLKLSVLSRGPSTATTVSGPSFPYEELISDHQFIYPGAQVIVQRVAWHQRPSIQHVAQTELPDDVWREPEAKKHEAKRPFPPEFICPLCRIILDHPVVIRCAFKCGRSVCRKCIEDRFKERRICPFCQGQVQNVVSNKALAAIINQLQLEQFHNVPERSKAGIVEHQEPQSNIMHPNKEQSVHLAKIELEVKKPAERTEDISSFEEPPGK